MNNPLSYISTERINLNAALLESNANKLFFNKFISELYKLEPSHSELNANALFWLTHWYIVYKIVFVAGCMAYADKLMWRGQIGKLPAWARYCIRHVPYKIDNNIDISDIEIITDRHIIIEGYSQIASYLNTLPMAISQRIKLLFPHYIDNLHFTEQNVISAPKLNLVAHYVKNYQN